MLRHAALLSATRFPLCLGPWNSRHTLTSRPSAEQLLRLDALAWRIPLVMDRARATIDRVGSQVGMGMRYTAASEV